LEAGVVSGVVVVVILILGVLVSVLPGAGRAGVLSLGTGVSVSSGIYGGSFVDALADGAGGGADSTGRNGAADGVGKVYAVRPGPV
jgi:hypothetical protein